MEIELVRPVTRLKPTSCLAQLTLISQACFSITFQVKVYSRQNYQVSQVQTLVIQQVKIATT